MKILSLLWVMTQALLQVIINIFKITTAPIGRTSGGSKLFGDTGNCLKYCMVAHLTMSPSKFPPP
jgi:hypothetical protein